MRKQVVQTDKVPPARVPLSQAIKVGEWVFVSGQLGIEPTTGKLASGGTGAQTRQVCENMKAILEAAGSSLDNVVRVVIYMVDLGELMEMNAVFSVYFPEAPPARTTVQVAGLVGGARVEIDATAII
jgi:2-iminobutanoate/2-iminopropanoate deaminase